LETLWDEDGGDSDFRMAQSFAPLVQHLADGLDIRLHSVVVRIQQVDGDYPVEVETQTSQGRKIFRAKHVIVTVPVAVLKIAAKERIIFEPPLHEDKLEAIESIGIRSALKIVMRFKTRFWPSDLHGMICADCLVPEFWIKNVGHLEDADGVPLSDDCTTASGFTLVGFASSTFANELMNLTQAQTVQVFLDQLNRIFSNENNQVPATDAFTGGVVFDWDKVPFIRGGYSFPSIFENVDTRRILGRSEYNETLHFAGEATDYDHAFMTVHSAIRTGARAANAVKSSFQ